MKKSVVRAVLICVPILLFSLAFFLYKPHQVYRLLPVKDSTSFNLYTYSDSVKHSTRYSTSVLIANTTDSVTFQYKLDSASNTPFAGITLLSKDSDFLSINTYDIFEIEIHASYAKRPQILFGLTADSVIQKNPLEKYCVKDLDLAPGKNMYKIPLDEFVTPSWWYAEQGISEKDIADVSYTRLHMINIQNCQLIARNTEDQITIKQIRFIKDARWFYIIAAICFIAYYAVYYFLFFIQNRTKTTTEKIEIRYTPVEMVNHSELDLDKLVAYISSHYDNPELSLKIIQEGTGLSETKVSQLLKNAYQLSFKQYLNQLRLTEAKRLLKDVSVPVSDIAYRVGYGNISHFNRVFKESEGHSPNDYRKKQ